MSMEDQSAAVNSSTNPYKGGLQGLQPFIDQIIQIIETKAPYENVKDLMLDTFGGEDIMELIPSVVEVAAVDNPTPASGCVLADRTYYDQPGDQGDIHDTSPAPLVRVH